MCRNCDSDCSANGWKTRPAAVSVTFPPPRLSKRCPRCDSKARICAEIEGCVKCNFSPAREKLFCRATSRNVVSQSKSKIAPSAQTFHQRRPTPTAISCIGFVYTTTQKLQRVSVSYSSRRPAGSSNAACLTNKSRSISSNIGDICSSHTHRIEHFYSSHKANRG